MNNYDYDNQPDPGDDPRPYPGDTPMVDPSDTFDADQERPIANFDWTKRVPPIPNTYDPREDEEIIEPMVAGERHHNRTATRFSVNHDWSRRGDNTKYREQK